MIRRLGVATAVLVLSWGTLAFGQVKLGLKHPEGKSLVTHTQSKLKQILTLAGMDIETNVSSFVVTTSAYGTRQADGTLVEENKVDKMQVEMSLPGGLSVQFDSGDPNKKADNALLEPVLDIYRATLKAPTRTIYDKENKVKAVEIPAEVTESVKEEYRGQFDPEKRKKAAAQEIAIFPDDAVNEGDTWERTNEADFGGGQTMEFKTEYKYAGTVSEEGKTLHKITSKVTSVKYSMDQNANAQLKITASDFKPTESEGTVLLDVEAGRVIKQTGKTRIEGELTAVINNMNFPGKLDLTIEIDSKLQP